MPFKDDPLNHNNSSENYHIKLRRNHQGNEHIEILLLYLVKISHRSKALLYFTVKTEN